MAAATVACWKCRSRIEVICIYCESGTVLGEPLSQFTVSSIRAIDSTLARQLAPWRSFREVDSEADQESYFANHCPSCGALHEDMHLHSEPGDPRVPHLARASRLSGTMAASTMRITGNRCASTRRIQQGSRALSF